MDIIQSLWIGPSLSLIEQLCIKSYLNLGYEFKLYIYDTVENIPEGTSICDANEILPKSEIFTTHNGSVAHFADWFRWKMLYENGGVWVDMDLIALRRFPEDKEILFGTERYMRPSIGFLKFTPRHYLPEYMVDLCENPNKILSYDSIRTKIKKCIRFMLGNKRSNVGWGESGGPVGFTKAVKHFNLLELGEPYPSFYPVPSHSWQNIFDDTFEKYPSMIGDSYGIHLWNEKIRREKKFDVRVNSAENSLFNYLQENN